jgi:hypothetical protein
MYGKYGVDEKMGLSERRCDAGKQEDIKPMNSGPPVVILLFSMIMGTRHGKSDGSRA